MKHKDEYELAYAYGRIHRFFEAFGLPGAVTYTETIIEAAASHKLWKHSQPYGLLFFMEYMQDLLAAVYQLNDCYKKETKVVIKAEKNDTPDAADVAAYTDKYCRNLSWEHFPRSLTARQFYDPYKVIEKCCAKLSKNQWKKFLHDLTEYALDSRDTINESLPAYNLFKMRRRMLQLIEACHLINVRTTNNEKNANLPKIED